MKEVIIWGLYGAGFMLIAMSIKLFITGKINLDMIPASIFGFVCGAIGHWLINSIMLEIHPEFPILAIICICLLGIGILGTATTIIFRRIE